MNGSIKKIDGIFPVTTSKAVFMDGTSKTLDSFLEEMSNESSSGSSTTPADKTNAVLHITGTPAAGFLMCGVLFKNPNLLDDIFFDIILKVNSGELSTYSVWVYGTDSDTLYTSGDLTQGANITYVDGEVGHTVLSGSKLAHKNLHVVFKIPDTVTSFDAEFVSYTDGISPSRVTKSTTWCGDLSVAKLEYEREYVIQKYISRWYGKSYLALGDSITDPNFNDPNYPYLIKDAMGFSEVINAAASGRTMSTVHSNSQFSSLTAGIYDFDLVTIMLGVNDWMRNAPLGEVQPIKSSFDEGTFCGCYQSVVEHILSNNITTTLVLLQPIQYIGHEGNQNTEGYTLDDLRQKIVEIAELYNIPAYRIPACFNAMNNSLYYRDGDLHIGGDGHYRLADCIAQYLCTI